MQEQARNKVVEMMMYGSNFTKQRKGRITPVLQLRPPVSATLPPVIVQRSVLSLCDPVYPSCLLTIDAHAARRGSEAFIKHALLKQKHAYDNSVAVLTVKAQACTGSC
jgi:hypothetical protein